MKKKSAQNVAFMGVFFGLSMALSFLEGLLPPMPNGIKPGLSNIVTMYMLFFAGTKSAFIITILKSLFVGLTRGATAGFMSASGGFLSVLIMLMLSMKKKNPFSYLMISVFGGIAHNLGQLLMSCLIMKNFLTLYYAPVLVLSGVIMGILTGTTLKYILPVLEKMSFKIHKRN